MTNKIKYNTQKKIKFGSLHKMLIFYWIQKLIFFSVIEIIANWHKTILIVVKIKRWQNFVKDKP